MIIRPSEMSWSVAYILASRVGSRVAGFVTICPTLAHGGVNAWSSAFLPAHYQGTPVGYTSIPAEKARFPFIANAETPRDVQRREPELEEVFVELAR